MLPITLISSNLELNSDGEVITTIDKAKEVLLHVYTRYTKSGGTDVNCIKEYIDARKEKLDGLLILTDGQTTEDNRSVKLPTPPGKTVILINEGGTDESLKNHGKIHFVDIPEVES